MLALNKPLTISKIIHNLKIISEYFKILREIKITKKSYKASSFIEVA